MTRFAAEKDEGRGVSEDAAFLAAHSAGDNRRLVELYRAAGLSRIDSGDIDAGCFFLTQAYVFSLEAGLRDSAELHGLLAARGREE